MGKFKGEEILQRRKGMGGLVKMPQLFYNPFVKKNSINSHLGYYDNCRTCQQYGRVLHEIEKGYDNKGFVSDE